MANVQHSALNDTHGIHEPKGISTTGSGLRAAYVSDGDGITGTWKDIGRLPGTGWGRYSNATYVGTTGLNIGTTETILPFDTIDNENELPISIGGGTSSLLFLSNEKLQFVNEDDLHCLTLTVTVYAHSGTPGYLNFLLYGSTDGTTYSTLLGKSSASFHADGQTFTETSLFNVSANMATHGAKIKVSTYAGTVDLINIGLISARVHKVRI